MTNQVFGPVHRQATEILRSLILNGGYRPGKRIASVRALMVEDAQTAFAPELIVRESTGPARE